MNIDCNTRFFIKSLKFTGSLFLAIYIVGCNQKTSEGESSTLNVPNNNCRVDPQNGFTICDRGATLGAPPQKANINKVNCYVNQPGPDAPTRCQVAFTGWIALDAVRQTNANVDAICVYQGETLGESIFLAGDYALIWQCPQNIRNLVPNPY
jgi:hypothetical protein